MSHPCRRIFHIRKHEHLWDDSSDEDDNEKQQEHNTRSSNKKVTNRSDSSKGQMASNASSSSTSILLAASNQLASEASFSKFNASSLSSSSVQASVTTPYMPRTLQQHSQRYSILPAFPTSFYDHQPPLLLANVPCRSSIRLKLIYSISFFLSLMSVYILVNKLNQEQLARRQRRFYPLPYRINRKNFDIPSYFRDHYQAFISSLIYQYNIDEGILDYNLYRLSESFRRFTDQTIRHHNYTPDQFELNDQQRKYALEFFLQIDGMYFIL